MALSLVADATIVPTVYSRTQWSPVGRRAPHRSDLCGPNAQILVPESRRWQHYRVWLVQ